MDLENIRVTQGRDRPGLVVKPLHGYGVSVVGCHHLYGDISVQLRVEGSEHGAHAPATYLLYKLVAT